MYTSRCFTVKTASYIGAENDAFTYADVFSYVVEFSGAKFSIHLTQASRVTSRVTSSHRSV
jgi:hypothetical protein